MSLDVILLNNTQRSKNDYDKQGLVKIFLKKKKRNFSKNISRILSLLLFSVLQAFILHIYIYMYNIYNTIYYFISNGILNDLF